MDKELKQLLKYCKDNDIKVVFTDSEILKDYGAMNPEAAKAMGFPDIDNNLETKEILIDETLPEETQIQNLKHELIEFKLMKNGMEYWPSHKIALVMEKEPFDFSQPIPKTNIIRVGHYDNKTPQPPIPLEEEKPIKKGWHRRFSKPKTGIVGSR